MPRTVLCYHAISSEWRHDLAVSAGLLERHVRLLLRRGFRPVSAAEAVRDGGRGKILHVTFDDAFVSAAAGLRVLERLGVPATVFAVTSYAEDGRPLAVPELAAEAALRPEQLATMDWDALRGLVERGVEVGSHTETHPRLTALLSDEELGRELRDSRARCEDELRRPCRFLAYPYGAHDPAVQRAARRAGYEAAFALGAGADAHNPFALPRIDLYGYDGTIRAAVKTSPLGRPAAGLLWRTRRRRLSPS
ncbi:MAG TPA: polysaccharide deacetylase family protein [Gaiellaceae bacterium]|nr:polysaccharide deacetylase family protein [Gaiellaceae bacterium]